MDSSTRKKIRLAQTSLLSALFVVEVVPEMTRRFIVSFILLFLSETR
jgi:hypothetical protein